MKIKDIILFEKTIAKVNKSVDVNIVLDIEGTIHSSERQGRHDLRITEEEIVTVIKSSIQKILQAHLQGKLGDDKGIIIYQKSSNLNVVGKLKLGGKIPEFVVITVMRKENFKPKPGTWKVTI